MCLCHLYNFKCKVQNEYSLLTVLTSFYRYLCWWVLLHRGTQNSFSYSISACSLDQKLCLDWFDSYPLSFRLIFEYHTPHLGMLCSLCACWFEWEEHGNHPLLLRVPQRLLNGYCTSNELNCIGSERHIIDPGGKPFLNQVQSWSHAKLSSYLTLGPNRKFVYQSECKVVGCVWDPPVSPPPQSLDSLGSHTRELGG